MINKYSKMYEQIIDNINSGVAIYEAINGGKNFKFKDMNKAGLKIDNLEIGEVIDNKITEVFPGVKEFGLFDVLKRVYKSGEAELFPLAKYEDNRLKGYRRNYVFKLDSGKVIAIYEDLTELKQTEEKLKDQKRLFAQLFENSIEGIALLDHKERVIKINKKFSEIFGYTEKDLKSMKLDDYITPDSKKNNALNYNKEVKEGKEIKTEGIRLRKDGKEINVSIHGFAVNLTSGKTGIYAIYNDITDRKKREKRIRYLSFNDELTGLYNRRYVENEMDRLDKSRNLPISIIVGDLDYLKIINDNYGHSMGDKYLRRTADILKKVVREEDIVGRIGGDEFIIILPNTPHDIVRKIVNRIRKEINKLNQNSDLPKNLKISLGCETMREKDEKIKEVFNKADQKMYKNKERNNL